MLYLNKEDKQNGAYDHFIVEYNTAFTISLVPHVSDLPVLRAPAEVERI